MRILAIDLGDARTGIAAGDDITHHVEPRKVIQEWDAETRFTKVLREVDDFGPDRILVGFPLNMDDTEGPRAKASRVFAERLQQATGIETTLQDERLTSFAADEALKGSGRTRKSKKRIQDAIAAAELIRDFLGSSA